MANTLSNLTSKQLLRAAAVRERIDKLEKKLATILNVTPERPVKGRVARRARKQAAGRSPKPVAEPTQPPKPKRKVSKAARARLAASAKKRWAAARAAGKNRL